MKKLKIQCIKKTWASLFNAESVNIKGAKYIDNSLAKG
jgi:hypothetical protein